MRKWLTYLVALFCVVACTTNKKIVVFGEGDKQLSFSSLHKDLGTIIEGDVKVFEYEFSNTGKSSVTILKAVPTCGCISMELPSAAIEPNNKGKIKTVFDSDGKNGLHKKSIVVQTSLPYPNDIINLSFEVEVKTP
jgi:hypothetical protein